MPCSTPLSMVLFVLFLKRSYNLAQAIVRLKSMLPLPALFWDYRHKPAHPSFYQDNDIKMHVPTVLYPKSL